MTAPARCQPAPSSLLSGPCLGTCQLTTTLHVPNDAAASRLLFTLGPYLIHHAGSAAGGQAIASVHSVTDDAEAVVRDSQAAFGPAVHVLINNAGIIRDKSFKKMSDAEWDLVQAVHLRGAFLMTKAVWGPMRSQKVRRSSCASNGLPLVWPD